MMFRIMFSVLTLLVVLGSPARATPFLGGLGSLPAPHEEIAEAPVVMIATLTWSGRNANDDGDITTVRIEQVLKGKKIVGGQKVFSFLIDCRVDPKEPRKVVLLCNEFQSRLNPYEAFEIKPNSNIVKYFEGLIARQKKPVERLRFAFDYLDDPDETVAKDAFRMIGTANERYLRAFAKDLPAGKIVRWLENEDTPADHLGVYAFLLAHCGKEPDAAVLLRLLEKKDKPVRYDLDQMMLAYTILKPSVGWERISKTLGDGSLDFLSRYAGLRASRFLHSDYPELVKKKEIVKAVCQLLPQADIADLAIEDLRRWNCWEVSDDVLKLYGQKTHDIRCIRQAILRYALSGNHLPQNKKFVDELRTKDPDFVTEVEELLQLESRNKP